MPVEQLTPAAAGFAMPAEWEAHAGCLMAWPCRRELWGSRFGEAKVEYAAVARAVAAFEPLTMVCNPGDETEVSFDLGPSVLRMLDETLRWIVEPGVFDVLVGASSKDLRLRGELVVK
jgi:agmatine/peptidylarginine deiminase